MFRLLGFDVHVRSGFVIFTALIVFLYRDAFGLWLAGAIAVLTLLHELGHAWTTYTLGPKERQAFVEVRGLDAWKQGEWHERGAEHASEILVWGLMDRPVVPGHIDQNSCGELLAGYLAPVGAEPLNGFSDLCSS